MTKPTKSNVPALRFPEFSEDWEEKVFNSFLIPEFREVIKPSSNYLAIGVRSHGRGTFQKPNSDPKNIAMDKLYMVYENDLIVNITFAWEGAIAIVPKCDHGGLVSHRFPTYVFSRDGVINEFFEYIIENKRFRQKLDLISPGGAGRNRVLSKKDFLNLTNIFPLIKEQTKIANFLSSVGRRIEQLNKKKQLLEQYKKGCMQKIFSQQLRFKDENGNNYPAWEESAFSNELEAIPTKKYQIKSSKFLTSGLFPVVDQGKETIAGYSNEASKIYSTDGVIVYGDHTTVVKFIDFDFIVGADGTKILKTKKNNIRFLFHYLSFNNVNSEGYKRHFSILKQVIFYIPSPEEQVKIANFLSAIDDKINLVQDELTKATSFKKGLLQQMFV